MAYIFITTHTIRHNEKPPSHIRMAANNNAKHGLLQGKRPCFATQRDANVAQKRADLHNILELKNLRLHTENRRICARTFFILKQPILKASCQINMKAKQPYRRQYDIRKKITLQGTIIRKETGYI